MECPSGAVEGGAAPCGVECGVHMPPSQIHALASLSGVAWLAITAAAHAASACLWAGYGRLPRREQAVWCNRITSAAHALVLVVNQTPALRDAALLDDPLRGVSRGHYVWGSVMYGFLVYDTLWLVASGEAARAPGILLHHALGLLCCCFGLYFHRLALFGVAIQVFFEATTPTLHALGCLKTIGLSHTRGYAALGLAFFVQFFLCRIVIAAYYGWLMLHAVLAEDRIEAWTGAGLAVYAALWALNAFWCAKLARMVRGRLANLGSQRQVPGPTAGPTAVVQLRQPMAAAGGVAHVRLAADTAKAA